METAASIKPTMPMTSMPSQKDILQSMTDAEDGQELVAQGYTVDMLSKLIRKLGGEEEADARRLQLADGKLIFTELPGRAHEVVTAAIVRQFIMFDESFIAAGHGDQLNLTGSSRTALNPNTSSDAGFVPIEALRHPHLLDLHGVPIPVLAVEVSASQGCGSSWMDKVAAHLSSPAVKMVIAVKLVEEGRMVRQIYACVFDHAHQVPGQRKPVARRVMSLRPNTHPNSLTAILRDIKVDSASIYAEGLAMGVPWLPCDAAGMLEYRITVPTAYIWDSVSAADLPPVHDMHIDLLTIVKKLRHNQLLMA